VVRGPLAPLGLAGGERVEPGAASIAVYGWVDVEDAAGRRVAADRAALVVVGEDGARLFVPGVSWDGRAEPVGEHGSLALAWPGVALERPSRDPAAVTGVDEGRVVVERGAGGAVRLDAEVVDPTRGALRVTRVAPDRVVVDGPTQSLGYVRLAVWARCDVVDGDGRLVAGGVPLRLWVGRRGDVRLDVDGVLSAHWR
jgi:hypothetical protein